MKYIFINLKRFDVPRNLGGICSNPNPVQWISNVMKESISYDLNNLKDISVAYLLPESLLPEAKSALGSQLDVINPIEIGSQGVFRQDIEPGGNFGAFTSNLPAAAAMNLGCSWSIIGHSEERKDKLEIMAAYDSLIYNESESYDKAQKSVNQLIGQEVASALKRNMNVLLCVGESSEEKGQGSFEEQQVRIKAVLRKQLELCLEGNIELLNDRKIVIGYEPIWAIGPGKTPPGQEYIAFVSAYIKEVVAEMFDIDIPVVYGGGLKEANAEMIAGIDTVDGGLVALTKFEQPIAFEPEGLKNIIHKYLQ